MMCTHDREGVLQSVGELYSELVMRQVTQKTKQKKPQLSPLPLHVVQPRLYIADQTNHCILKGKLKIRGRMEERDVTLKGFQQAADSIQ